MTKTAFADVVGYWHDRTNTSETFCVGIAIVSPDTPTEEIDALLDRDDVFYVFTSDEDIVGVHHDFSITSFHPIGE